MSDQPRRQDAAQRPAPQRDQFSLVNTDIRVPVNPAVTANVQSDGSITGPHRIVRL